ncbi:hypothetical protein BDP55DRAFT_388463 [Colletotrichum godetiae]|uniref:Uncharacterized protein n=1 Tax=Colletotrichum godetiae TaxID=1209918 RepID=A0AAJ0EZX8_9PEZI|nr:uncharacterized protein BDP55DRAFT_388463 [Colletotrichum godetiae]KAK1690086.1 hypothetical protein BDP55DRAFT_388463 [Colletotrichum godetiae]
MLDASPVPVRPSAGHLFAFPSLTFQPINGPGYARCFVPKTQELVHASRRRRETSLNIHTPPFNFFSCCLSSSFPFPRPSPPHLPPFFLLHHRRASTPHPHFPSAALIENSRAGSWTWFGSWGRVERGCQLALSLVLGATTTPTLLYEVAVRGRQGGGMPHTGRKRRPTTAWRRAAGSEHPASQFSRVYVCQGLDKRAGQGEASMQDENCTSAC